MERLCNVSLSCLITLLVIQEIATLLVCYIIAVVADHASIVPIISDCGVMKPEKYFFQIGSTISSMLLLVASIGIYLSDKAYQHVLLLFLSVLGCIGLAGLGNANIIENWTAHSGR